MPVYKNNKNGTWYTKFRAKDWNGSIRYITKRGFSTKREAVEYERNYMVTLSGSPDMTFSEFTAIYKSEVFPRIKESTIDTKTNIIDKKILPFFGSKKLIDITSADVLRWQNTLINEKKADGQLYKKSYLKTVHNQLSAMLNHAVKYYNLPKNVAGVVGNMGNEKGIEMKFWDLEQYKKFSKAIIDKPSAFFAFEILYWCGLREGEMLALTMNDFDFNNNTVTISKTYHKAHGQDIVTDPKTPKSNRTIGIPEKVACELQDYFSMLYGVERDNRIFEDISKTKLTHIMQTGSEKAGVPRIRIHDLRHSHVSLLINSGFSAHAIAARVGHESSDITYRYAHLFPSTEEAMVSKLNQLKGE